MGAKADMPEKGDEADEGECPDALEVGESRVQVQPPLLPLVRRAVVLLGALLYSNTGYMPTRAIRNIVSCLVGENVTDSGRYWYLGVNGLALATHVAILVSAGAVALAFVRARRLRKSVPDHPAAVRADDAGLHAEGRLIVARADVASAEVAVDPDVGFAVIVRSRGDVTTRVPLRTEADARCLAAALDPARSQDGALVFEGVADARRSETRVAAAAVLGVGAVAAVHESLNALGFWHWVDNATPYNFWQHPEMALFWVVFAVVGLGMWAIIALAALAAKPVLQRLRPGRVAVDRAGVAAGEGKAARRIDRQDIERVDVDDSPEVKLGLRDGRAVRLRFSADRPVLERDAFVARVRAIMNEAPVEMYPAAETSGVRVAVQAEGACVEAEKDEEARDEEEDEARAGAHAARSR